MVPLQLLQLVLPVPVQSVVAVVVWQGRARVRKLPAQWLTRTVQPQCAKIE
jgi:hypothetical protein